jgi:hypothetical protein
MNSVGDIESAARQLSTKYDGTLRFIYTSALHGFALSVDDSKAISLANESVVCWVEQDQQGHG